MRRKRIYLDTAAGTPVDRQVLKAMLPFYSEKFGNPSSIHEEGVRASIAVRLARENIARLLEAHPDEILFTGSGTESDNLAIIGVARALLQSKKISQPGHIVTSQIEHRAVLEACSALEKEGWSITYLPVQVNGIVNPDDVKAALSKETVLVSIMYANNEIGTIQPIKEIAKILRHHRKQNNENRLPYFHIDACQTPRFLPLSVEKLGIDMMTLNGSKVYGPKGIGCLFVKRNSFISPIAFGGGQERGLRSGTENVAGIVGLSEALKIAQENREDESASLGLVRDYFIRELVKIEGVQINGDLKQRLPNNVSATFDILGELMVLSLDAKGIAVSTGSACSSHHKDDAHVIMALGEDREYADRTIRFSLGRDTNIKEINQVISAIKSILNKNRNIKI